MEEQRFDDLARLVAQKTSRRQVLKLLAGATVGGFLRMDPTRAFASNSACAHFCNAVFGADTPAAEECTSGAAHSKGLCYSACGPGGTGGTLCGPQSGGYYTSYSGTTCGCPAGQTCSNGTCVTDCAGCGATFAGGTCTCAAGTVAITTANNTTTCLKPCIGNQFCSTRFCVQSYIDGGSYCTIDDNPSIMCISGGNADCPAGTFCEGVYCRPAGC